MSVYSPAWDVAVLLVPAVRDRALVGPLLPPNARHIVLFDSTEVPGVPLHSGGGTGGSNKVGEEEVVDAATAWIGQNGLITVYTM